MGRFPSSFWLYRREHTAQNVKWSNIIPVKSIPSLLANCSKIPASRQRPCIMISKITLAKSQYSKMEDALIINTHKNIPIFMLKQLI